MAMAMDDTKTMTTAGDDKAGEVAAQCPEGQVSEREMVKEIDRAISLCDCCEHFAGLLTSLDNLLADDDVAAELKATYEHVKQAWPVTCDQRSEALLRIADSPTNSPWVLNAKMRLVGAAIVGCDDGVLEPETADLLRSVVEDAERIEREYILKEVRREDARREVRPASAARGLPLKGYVDGDGEVFAFSGNQADLIPPLKNG